MNPSDAEAYAMLASYLDKMGSHSLEGAISHYKQAIHLDRSRGTLYFLAD